MTEQIILEQLTRIESKMDAALDNLNKRLTRLEVTASVKLHNRLEFAQFTSIYVALASLFIVYLIHAW